MKSWKKSKTLAFNAFMTALVTVEASAGLIQPYVPSNVYAWGMMLLAVGNAVLRVITTQGLGR